MSMSDEERARKRRKVRKEGELYSVRCIMRTVTTVTEKQRAFVVT